MPALTKLSTKGQVVIPTQLRKELGLEPGAQLIASRMQDFLILKRVSIADPKKEFRRLAARGQERAKRLGVRSEGDVVRMIHAGRAKR